MRPSSDSPATHRRPDGWVIFLVLAVSLFWSYWTTLREIVGRWEGDPRYSHGYFVPVFAVALLWLRKGRLSTPSLVPSWWGVPILVAGVGLHLAAAYYFIEWFDGLSLLLCLLGIAVLLGGRSALSFSWPAIAFLFFMIPLPFRVEVGLAQPLQQVATKLSTFAIQSIGIHATSEGNVIVLDDDIRIGVVEACSGLSMLFTFIAISTGMAIIIRRPILDKALIILSAIPIGLIANVARITATSLAHVSVGSRLADLIFHDLAGWLMMPLAVVLLLLELRLLSHLFIAPGSPALTIASAGTLAPSISQPGPAAREPVRLATGLRREGRRR